MHKYLKLILQSIRKKKILDKHLRINNSTFTYDDNRTTSLHDVFDSIDLFKEIKILLLLALLSYFGPKLQGNCARAQSGLGSFVCFFFYVGFRQKLLNILQVT